MSVLPIITAPDPRLKLKAKPVEKVDTATRRLMDDMLETMYGSIGVGLAAPQVGVAPALALGDLPWGMLLGAGVGEVLDLALL